MTPRTVINVFILLAVFMLAQFYAGVVGIAHHFGALAAIAAIVAAVWWRFTLPLTGGAFLCAMSLWGWPWPFAFLFAAPGLALMIPGTISALLLMRKGKVTSFHTQKQGEIIEGVVIRDEEADEKTG